MQMTTMVNMINAGIFQYLTLANSKLLFFKLVSFFNLRSGPNKADLINLLHLYCSCVFTDNVDA